MSNHLKAKRPLRRRVLLSVAVGCLVGAFFLNTPPSSLGFLKWFTPPFGGQKTTRLQDPEGEVLSAHDEAPIIQDTLLFRIKTRFTEILQAANLEISDTLTVQGTTTFEDNITATGAILDLGPGQVLASNIVYSLNAGEGLEITGTQELTISSTGVLSLQGETGEVSFTAGDGVTISGTTISNEDPGSAQNIFQTIKIGSTTFSASSNTDTLEFAAGTGVTLGSDSSNKKITITADSAALNISGWESSTGRVYLETIGDNVGIGTSTPTNKLHVVGGATIDGDLSVTGSTTVLSGFNNSGGGITNAGSITGGTGVTSSGTITFSGLSTGLVQSSLGGVLSSSALNLAGGSSYITGTLPTTSGGTGVTSYNAGDILYASGANTLAALGLGGDGEVLTVSGGSVAWATVSGGGDTPCSTCLVNNPGSTQTITPGAATATGLSIRQASSGSVDVFNVTSNDGSTTYFRVDSSGNVLLGSGITSTQGNLSIAPAGTDPIQISPVAQGSNQFTGTITSEDLTANRTWTFPDASGTICLATGNCSGTSASMGGSGNANYLAKFSGTYTITDSVLYDNGTNVGLGTTTPTSKLHVVGTTNLNGATTVGGALTASSTLGVTSNTTIGGTLTVTGGGSFQSTLEATGATTLSSTLGVTGLTTLSSNLRVNGTGNSYFSGNLGIGSTVPDYALDIVGDINFSGVLRANDSSGSSGQILVSQGASSPVWQDISTAVGSTTFLQGGNAFSAAGVLGTTDTQALQLITNNQTRITIDANGNVGIGTTTPVGKLNVEGAVTGKALTILNETGDQAIFTASSSGTPRFVIQNDGNVGIGSTAPAAELDVNGALQLANGSTGTPTLRFAGNTTAGFYMEPLGGGYWVFAAGS